ncbi:putative F-box-like domain protein [Rhizoctonia solani 123E]|uniref:Putative F-box-like domain protein n=1 Tax=Rhizoctonia solani 123E TaxID=1423351 RepID=A0A074RUN1_9AGAM|nr:putative F-box-like domain protein [Rhizoctonia solani 123E]
MAFIDNLPQELIFRILEFCGWYAMIQLSLTCKTYHRLVRGSRVFELHSELQSSGYQLSDNGSQRNEAGDVVKLLKEFRAFQDGWLYLKLGKPQVQDSADPDMRLYELRQGYYAAALSTSYAQPSIVKITDLHSGTSTKISPGVQFSEFQIDPSQGLVVLVSIESHVTETSTVHLRSSLTGLPHASASQPDWTIRLPFHMERRSSGIFVEVMDELLAVKYVSFEKNVSNILIWNWKSSVLLNRIECCGMSCTFGFFTPSSLVIFQSINDSGVNMLVYNHIRSPSDLPERSLAEFEVSSYPIQTPGFEFAFPEFPEGASAYLLMRSEPVPTLGTTGPAIFMPTPASRIIQLSMSIIQSTGPERGLRQYQIFLSKQRLLKCMAAYDLDSALPIRVPPEDWIEHSTRWFTTSVAVSPWICRTYGTRFIQTHPHVGDDDDQDQPLEYLSVLEFHEPTIRRMTDLGCDTHLSMWSSGEMRQHVDWNSPDEVIEYFVNTLRKQSAPAEEDAVFVDIIDETVPSYTPFNGKTLVTRLPYRIVIRKKPLTKHSGWMMDNNLIIGMPGDEMENVQNEHMTVFIPTA